MRSLPPSLLVAIALIAAALAWHELRSDRMTRAAEEVMTTCAPRPDPAYCYDAEIPKLMDQGMTMEDAFVVTKIIQERSGSYYFCHVLGHNIASKETAKDPSKWTEVIARCPTGMCANGCLHGAAQERFRKETLDPDEVDALVPELSKTCESSPGGREFTGLEQRMCFHALGHLLMYVTGADTPRAASICDAVAFKGNGRDFRENCYEGAFMQVFQALESEDVALVQDIAPRTDDEAAVFCAAFEGAKRAACHRESWVFSKDALATPAGLARFCELIPDSDSVRQCYDGAFFNFAVESDFNEDAIVPYCEAQRDREGQCFGQIAFREIEADYDLIPKATSLCRAASDENVGQTCYDELLYYSWFGFHPGSDAHAALCAALPEPYRARCRAGEDEGVDPSDF